MLAVRPSFVIDLEFPAKDIRRYGIGKSYSKESDRQSSPDLYVARSVPGDASAAKPYCWLTVHLNVVKSPQPLPTASVGCASQTLLVILSLVPMALLPSGSEIWKKPVTM